MNAVSRQARRRIALKGAPYSVGFTPVGRHGVRHRRIALRKTAEIAKECEGKTIEQLKALGLPTDMAQMEQEVGRRMSRDLPVEPMVRRYHNRPCRNNSAKWRRSGVDTGPYEVASA